MSGNILIVAGEASGDLHGANLIKALKEINPSFTFCGIGGERMKGQGFNVIEDSRNLSVVGISEAIFKARKLLSAFAKLKKALDEKRPDIVILIDFPDFNLHFANEVKKRNIPVIYYISPQIWAWRKGRVKKIARLIDKMLVIFPFEADIYKNNGVDVKYVGHPLVDTVSCHFSKSEALSKLGLSHGPVVALLPGSRGHEIARLLPIMDEAASIIKREIPDAQFVLPAADTVDDSFLNRFIHGNTSIKIVRDNLYTVLRSSDAAIVASGTATLETALMEIPMVIVYKLSFLTAIVGRIFVHVDDVGLPNIVAGKRVVPELIQEDAKPENIAEAILKFLNDKGMREKTIANLRKIRERLGSGNASRNVAEEICTILNKCRL